MSDVKIISISLIKNEDLHIKKILNNVVDFCDEMIILDNMSTDGTYDIAQKFTKDHSDKVNLKRIESFKHSGKFIQEYIGTKTWVMSVDGDDLYDHIGLKRVRAEILDGKFDDKWQVSGYFLNATEVDWDKKLAKGYMSPPGRPCVKLYNFYGIKSWPMRRHRMHGGRPRFKRGYGISSRYSMHEEMDWEESYLRYLHLCFIPRSSQDNDSCRVNPSEIAKKSKRTTSHYKTEKYEVGDIHTKDISNFI